MNEPEPRIDEETLPAVLRELGVVAADDEVAIEPAGDGNINWVRRVRAAKSGRTWIIKHARRALERFPQYAASTERIVFEHRWFEIARGVDRDGVCPGIVLFDADRRLLVLEDLGDAERLDHALARGAEVGPAVAALARLLAAVHAATRGEPLAAAFANDDMRTLHGEHIFALPFAPNDFPLEPELRARAERVWADGELAAVAARAYARYREPRGALVHGDVQAGNVLLPPGGGVKLLDAEIAHVGDPAFDVGVLLAHLILPGLARRTGESGGPDPEKSARDAGTAWSAYAGAPGAEAGPAFAEAALYAGIEVMRRTIGAARVAAVADTAAALRAVELASALIRRPPESPDALARTLRAHAAGAAPGASGPRVTR